MKALRFALEATAVLAAVRFARAQATSPPGPPRPIDSCASRIGALRARLDSGEATPRGLRRPPEGVRVPTAAAGDRIDSAGPSDLRAPVLVITADGDLSLDGRLVDGATVAEQAAAIRRDRAAASPNPARDLLVWIDADLPVRRVLPLLEALARDGTPRLLVQVDATPARAAPATPWVTDVLRRAEQAPDAVENVTMIEAALSRAVGTCTAIRRQLAARRTTADRWAALTAAVLEGLDECDCRGVDVDALGALLAAIGESSDRRRLRALPLRPTPETNAVAVSLGRDATVEDLVRAIGNLAENQRADQARPVHIEQESRP